MSENAGLDPEVDPNTGGDILAQLDIEQRVRLTSGADFWHTRGVPEAGIPPMLLADGPHGLRVHAEGSDHLGAFVGAAATCFPPEVALGNTWDAELVGRVAAALGAEARAAGVGLLLAPGMNMKRDPRGGRNFEYFSEVPFHTAELALAFVRGVQSTGVGATLKHFAANNQETDRLRVSADVDEKTLREIYLRAFERVVREGQPRAVMSAYNRINGVPSSENRRLLTDILRGEWGFEGLVVSDWIAVRDRVAAVSAGLDLEMPGTDGRTDAELLAAVGRGEVSAQAVSEAARRVATLARAPAEPAGVRAHLLGKPGHPP